MKHPVTLKLASVLFVLPLPMFAQSAQSPNNQDSASSQNSTQPGANRAAHMVAARGYLVKTLDANKDQTGSTFEVKLSKTVHLPNGTELPKNALLLGTVTTDDMQVEGKSKLTLRVDRAKLESGQVYPIKATIVGIFKPRSTNFEDNPVTPGDEVPNSWNDGTLRVDQIGVVPGTDLHSRIASHNSGTFVSSKSDVKIVSGSEFQFALSEKHSGGDTVSTNTSQQ